MSPSLPRAFFAAFMASFLSAAALPANATADKTKVDVELVMAVDISYSMDEKEQRLQRAGYAAALVSPAFLSALKSGPTGKIAVTYLQWASYNDQNTVIDWSLIDGPDSAKAVADRLLEAPYRRARRTSIAGGIDAAMRAFENNGFDGARKVIDVSGDGPNNDGPPVVTARNAAVAKGVTVNGLPLVGIRAFLGPADIKDLDIYYEDCVIGGEASFMIPVHDVKNFVDATRTKLVREVAWRPQRLPIVPASARQPRISCTIGEDLWRGRWRN